jgi:hypothetical protein
MTNKEALQIIAEAINIALSKGAFGLIESSNIIKALETLNEVPKEELKEL